MSQSEKNKKIKGGGCYKDVGARLIRLPIFLILFLSLLKANFSLFVLIFLVTVCYLTQTASL